MKRVLAAVGAFACGCVVHVPAQRPPPPPPAYAQPPPPVYTQPPPSVYTRPPPPPVYTQAPPPAYTPPPPPPTVHQAVPVPAGPQVHGAMPVPNGRQQIDRNHAIDIALRYAAEQRFDFERADADWHDGLWDVRIHGRPPTPGQLRVHIDGSSGAVVGAEREGHDHDDHGHGHY